MAATTRRMFSPEEIRRIRLLSSSGNPSRVIASKVVLEWRGIDSIPEKYSGSPESRTQYIAYVSRAVRRYLQQHPLKKHEKEPDVPDVVALDQLCGNAIRGAQDFAFFYEHYIGPEVPGWVGVPNWQAHLAGIINEGSDSHLLVTVPPGHGKGLALDTPLPTPDGWTSMGQIAVGSQLLDDQGRPCTVTGLSQINFRPCFRLTFADGSVLVADDQHLFKVKDHSAKRSRVLSVGELFPRHIRQGRPNFSVPVAAGFDLPEVPLLIDPYVLGVWLGDGASAGARITSADEAIAEEIRLAGYEVRAQPQPYRTTNYSVIGLQAQLRALGLLGNKHIPATYLRASYKQRLSLLQGLMDTDGSCANGQCEFSNTNLSLIEATEELIRSLGVKVRRYGGRAMLNGTDHGPKYRLSFYPDEQMFRLWRKHMKQRLPRDSRRRWLVLKSIEPVASVPTRCLQVDSPSRLFLAGRGMIPTHNTTLLLAWVVWRIVKDRNVKGFYITKSERLAKWRLQWIKYQLTKNRRLLEDFGRFLPDSDEVWTRQEIQVYGAGALSKDPTLAVYGAGQGILGTRVDFIVADDVVDTKNSRSGSDREELERWWTQDVQTRRNPAGKIVVLGSRLGAFDLFGYIGRITDPETNIRLYNWVRLKAHDVARCDGITHGEYPDGCLLFPQFWTWPEMQKARAAAGPNWALVYQQEDVPAEDTLVHRSWIFGGNDHLGYTAEGCLDPSRALGEVPSTLAWNASVVTVDPSVENFWAVQWWLVDTLQEPPKWNLIDFARMRMGAAGLLDFVHGGQPVGLLHEWVERARRLHAPIANLIIESNAAQKWLLKTFLAKRWAQQFNIAVIPHHTVTNKGDPKLGVWGLGSRFRSSDISLPDKSGDDRNRLAIFVEELTTYPHHETDDTVMAAWFLLWNEKRLRVRGSKPVFASPQLPPYMLGLRNVVKINKGRS